MKTKRQLRSYFRNKLKFFVKLNYVTLGCLKSINSIKLLYQFKKLFNQNCKLHESKFIALYYPLYYEINCLPICFWLQKLKITTLLPKINKISRKLDFYIFDKNIPLQKNNKDIQEVKSDNTPLVPQVLIVPLLAFDNEGNRLGQGGGYYDFTLSQLQKNKDILIIGVAYSWQETSKIPALQYDIKLNAIVTEKFFKIFH